MDYVTFSLTGGVLDSKKQSDFETVAVKQFDKFSGGNVVGRIKSAEDILKRHLERKIKKERALNRLFEMLENEDISVDNIKKRIKANEQEICSIEEQIKQAESDLFDLQEIQKNVSFFVGSKDLLFEIWDSLQSFDPQDRKALLESLLSESIQVVPKNKFLRPTTVDIKLRWNDAVFQALINEKKIAPIC